MSSQQPARVDIPRLDGETPRAYAARVEYLTAGAGRSLEKLRQSIGMRSVRYLEVWSTRYRWVEHARRYDETLAGLAAQDAATKYRAELEEHRTRYAKTGKDLHAVAAALLAQLGRAVYGQTIKGADGNTYTIPAIELTAGTITQVSRAITTAADLEAHALRIAELLPRLTTDEPDTE